MHATLDEWIRREAITFSADSPETFNPAVDKVIASLGDSVELLGFGEALHGGEDILILRNKLFQRLVEAHGYRAIAIESSFPSARLVNQYIAGDSTGESPASSPASYDDVKEHGFSHGFGRVEANRELVEWMRQHNADPSRRAGGKLRFYGFDIPGTAGYASPSQVLHFAVDYLASIDRSCSEADRQRIDSLLGEDAQWENPAVYTDPTKAVGLSPAAAALRIATEDLLTELRTRRPDCIARSGRDAYLEALQHAVIARELLNSHAALAAKSSYAALLGIRDALMADNLAHILERERDRGKDRQRPRGKVLVFAHNSHLQRGKVEFPILGQWWPAGAHLADMLGPRYAVIGSAIGDSDANGIAPPEPCSLEARLTAQLGAQLTTAPPGDASALLIPTHHGDSFPAAEIAALPIRSSASKNPSYKPLNPQSFTDFDCLAFLPSTPYTRGGQPL